jgi:hypothetical protein
MAVFRALNLRRLALKWLILETSRFLLYSISLSGVCLLANCRNTYQEYDSIRCYKILICLLICIYFDKRSENFTAAKINKIISGYQPYQVAKYYSFFKTLMMRTEMALERSVIFKQLKRLIAREGFTFI